MYSEGSVGESAYLTLSTASSSTNNVERLRIDSSGRVGIGNNNPSALSTGRLIVGNGSASTETITVFSSTSGTGNIHFADGTSGSDRYRGYLSYEHTSNALAIGTNDAERMRIDSSGRLLVGTSSSRDKFFNSQGLHPGLQLEGTAFQSRAISVVSNSTSGAGDTSALILGRQRSGTAGGYTLVNANDVLGGIYFQGADGEQLVEGAQIRAEVDGTPGANDMPGRLVFRTTADGASGSTERMRIDSSGRVGIGETSPDYPLCVSGTGVVRAKVTCTDNHGAGAGIYMRTLNGGSTVGTATIAIDNSGNLKVFSGGSSEAERMRITSGGTTTIFAPTSNTGTEYYSAPGRYPLRIGVVGGVDNWVDFVGNYQNTIGTGTYIRFRPTFQNTNMQSGMYIGAVSRTVQHSDLVIGRIQSGANTSTAAYKQEKVRITSSGKVGIGTTTPLTLVSAEGTDAAIAVHYPGNSLGGIAALSAQRLGFASCSVNDDLVFGYTNQAMGSSAFVQRMKINNGSGAVNITGSLSKGSGSFKISHPLPAKTDTHHLVHSFIEGPQADLIYRGYVDLVDGQATVNIDTAARMTEGTFEVLCTNVSCFTSNESDWTAVKGSVTGNILTITAQDATSTSKVSWMVVGERKDPHMLETDWTDENGRVITEPLKSKD